MTIRDILDRPLPHRVYTAHGVARAVSQSMKAARNLEARSKYMPHQGEQEVARRQRQAARDDSNQRQRAIPVGFGVERVSRRGRILAQTA